MRRHDLVYVHAGVAFTTPCAEEGGLLWQAARDWINHGRPLVAARQSGDDQRVLLGLSLPLKHDRKRLTIQVEPSAISAVRPPIGIRQCLAGQAESVADVLLALDEQISLSGVRLGVFGSLAWEALSGEAYRHADSDIDVICDVSDLGQLEAALAALAQARKRLPCRLDGELRFPDGRAVAWLELSEAGRTAGKKVLVKGEKTVELMPVEELLASLNPYFESLVSQP
jgi:phosphoribosyl-dephospho-CoA transferase